MSNIVNAPFAADLEDRLNQMAERLGATEVEAVIEQWLASRANREDLIADAAGSGDDDRRLELWKAFLRSIDHLVNPDTLRVRNNALREWTTDIFGDNDKRRLSGFYSAAQRQGILTKVDEERSTDIAGGNRNKMAPIYQVSMLALLDAIDSPELSCPGYNPVRKRILSGQVRDEAGSVDVQVTVTYNDDEGALW